MNVEPFTLSSCWRSFPLFVLFLAICQLALIGVAEAVVRHSAFAAVRSAVVTLEDKPENYDGAPRGSLSLGRPGVGPGADTVLRKLGFTVETEVEDATTLPQQGARMVPIQVAALLPLLSLAPRSDNVLNNDTLASATVSVTERQLPYALAYSRAATQVTLHDHLGDESLASDPIGAKATVTVMVTYLYQCTVPVVRVMMCGGLRNNAKLEKLVGIEARFKRFTAKATLPNQGADYYAREGVQ